MKTLLLDTENAPLITTAWGIHDQSLRYTDIIQHWFFICSQWKWLGEDKLNHSSLLHDPKRFIKDHTDDYHVVKTTCEIIEQCDVLVGHNIKKHDLRKLKAKIAKHNLPPLKDVFVVDTYEWSKKFGFTSRKLGDLCDYLDVENRKLEHDPGIFKLACQGDVKAIRKTIRYGLGDLPTLEDVYLRLRPHIKNHPNHNRFSDDECCPDCGSKRFHKRGIECGKQTYACYNCRARFNEDKLKRKK